MAKKKETRRQQNIRKTLKKEVGGKWWKVHGSAFQESGQPDIDGAVDGIPFKFEVKEPLEGAPSPIQLEQMSEWRDVGVISCIVETPSQAVALVKAAQASSGKRRRGRKLYKWICSTLRATHGEDMGYGRDPRGRAISNRRRSARWAVDQLREHLGKIPKGAPARIFGVP